MLQSRAEVAGAGILAQTSTGSVARTLVGGSGLLVTNPDGQGGNPSIAADIATLEESQGGLSTSKLMTPERVRQSFQGWNPFPVPGGKASGLLTTDGYTPSWSWKLITPASGTQSLPSSSRQIEADRSFVRVLPTSSLTLTGTPVIVDGYDGQFLTIANVSTTASVTLPDEALMTGSNLRLGGRNVELAPRQSITLVFVDGLGDWVLTQQASASSGTGVSGPTFSADGQISLFNGTAGDRIKAFTGSGLLQAVNGVPSIVSGNASDCVRVDGTSGVCGLGNVTGASSSTAGQIAVYTGTTGTSLGTMQMTGVLKSSDGVPAVVTGNATDCVRVDGTSGPCGAGGALTITDYTWYPTASSGISGTGTSVASGWQVPASSATITTNGTNVGMNFADSVATPTGILQLMVPTDWAGGPATVKLHFTPGSTGCSNGENIAWKIRTGAHTPGALVAANGYPTWSEYALATHVLATGAANTLQMTTSTALDVSSWAANRRAAIWIERDTAADSGTCAVMLLGIELGVRRALQ